MKRQWLRLLGTGALALTSLLAHAQYSWVDDKGLRVFSDRPPPSGTPPERILKTPRGLEPRPAPAEALSDKVADKAPEKTNPPGLAERDAEFRKRLAQRETDEKKAAEEAARMAAKDENCALAREDERALSSGVRIARVDAKGEKAYLSDEERTQKLERVRRTLQSCKR